MVTFLCVACFCHHSPSFCVVFFFHCLRFSFAHSQVCALFGGARRARKGDDGREQAGPRGDAVCGAPLRRVVPAREAERGARLRGLLPRGAAADARVVPDIAVHHARRHCHPRPHQGQLPRHAHLVAAHALQVCGCHGHVLHPGCFLDLLSWCCCCCWCWWLGAATG